MAQKRIVLTGGPCAGKTTLVGVIEHTYQGLVAVVPEAASILFSGGFPRWSEEGSKQATQRAIFYVQRQLECTYASKFPERMFIQDRGTIDGAVYWPKGVDDFFSTLNTTLSEQLSHYHRVIYLQSASRENYLAHVKSNPNRTESWEEAHAPDALGLQKRRRPPMNSQLL